MFLNDLMQFVELAQETDHHLTSINLFVSEIYGHDAFDSISLGSYLNRISQNFDSSQKKLKDEVIEEFFIMAQDAISDNTNIVQNISVFQLVF